MAIKTLIVSTTGVSSEEIIIDLKAFGEAKDNRIYELVRQLNEAEAERDQARAERDAALEDGEEREAYKQVIDWGRGLANQVLEMVNLHYTEKEETFKPFAILPPMSQLLSYYAATLNEWIGKLIGEEED